MKFTYRSTPIALLVLCILGYGLYILWMGFYWDDWPWVWFSHVMGSMGMLKIDLEHRPLSGLILWIGSLLAGESPVGWQIYNLLFRWLTGVSLWWMLLKLWPRRGEFAAVVSLLYLVYPGFSQQFVAVNNSRHLLPLALFFLSIGWMVKACRDRTHYWRDTSISLVLSLGGMLISDYYYGLELLRPVFLWYLNLPGMVRPRLQAVLRDWLPYMIPLGGIFIWRYWVSQQYFYRVRILDDLSGTNTNLRTIVLDPVEFTLGAWGKIFELPDLQIFGPRMLLFFVAIVILGILGTFLYLWKFQTDPVDSKWHIKPLILGMFASIVAFIPFWAIDLEVEFAFPNDRLTLPVMMGASLILASVIFLVVRNRPLRSLLLAVTIGMSLGVQLKNANDYRRDWKYQTAFFEQLTWRVPGIEYGTTMLANPFPDLYSTDNSLIAPLNWIYAPEFTGGDLPIMLLYTSRFGEDIDDLTIETPIERGYRFFRFNGSMGDSILIYHAPPACLRVLDPLYDRQYPLLPDEVRNFLQFSNLQRIIQSAPSASIPEQFMGISAFGNWCYYFEKADLARQVGDWAQVAELGDLAFSLDDSPNHASERVPFIEGYAHVGRWKNALKLTQETIEINKFMGPMLCDTWERIDENVTPSPEKDEALSIVQEQLKCKP